MRAAYHSTRLRARYPPGADAGQVHAGVTSVGVRVDYRLARPVGHGLRLSGGARKKNCCGEKSEGCATHGRQRSVGRRDLTESNTPLSACQEPRAACKSDRPVPRQLPDSSGRHARRFGYFGDRCAAVHRVMDEVLVFQLSGFEQLLKYPNPFSGSGELAKRRVGFRRQHRHTVKTRRRRLISGARRRPVGSASRPAAGCARCSRHRSNRLTRGSCSRRELAPRTESASSGVSSSSEAHAASPEPRRGSRRFANACP